MTMCLGLEYHSTAMVLLYLSLSPGFEFRAWPGTKLNVQMV